MRYSNDSGVQGFRETDKVEIVHSTNRIFVRRRIPEVLPRPVGQIERRLSLIVSEKNKYFYRNEVRFSMWKMDGGVGGALRSCARFRRMIVHNTFIRTAERLERFDYAQGMGRRVQSSPQNRDKRLVTLRTPNILKISIISAIPKPAYRRFVPVYNSISKHRPNPLKLVNFFFNSQIH